MKKFTKIMLIIAVSLLGAGLIFCGVSTAMGASVWRMAKNGELRYGNWHIGPVGLIIAVLMEMTKKMMIWMILMKMTMIAMTMIVMTMMMTVMMNGDDNSDDGDGDDGGGDGDDSDDDGDDDSDDEW